MRNQLPPPEGEPSMLAADTLNVFEQILYEENPVRPNDAPDWLIGGVYKVDDTRIVFPFSGRQKLDSDRALVTEYSGDADHLWVPSGIVRTSVSGYFIPTPEKPSYLLGRLIDKGDPRKAEVQAAIYAYRRVEQEEEYVVEYIADKLDRFIELAGWLKKINNANRAKNAQNVGHSALSGETHP